MPIHSLNNLQRLRLFLIAIRRKWLSRGGRLVIAEDARVSLAARFIRGGKGSITVGRTSVVAFKTLVCAVDTTGEARPVAIRENCFIGGGSTINPGVTIGPNSIVGAGSVVFDDVPPFCIAVGNPARVVARDAEIGAFGMLSVAAENSRRYWRPKT